ncbi:hypothetical protein [Roseobacter sp.]|uniref:hypothetical protein n=1 Tax=Roseobacter sp. TaxID=1907202 RepID=UPI00385975CC
MKVGIKHVEKKTGMVFKKTHHGVELSVDFNDEERAIIEERKLQKDVILERGYPSDVDAEKHEDRGIGKILLTAATKGADANHFHLTISKLMRGPDTFWFETPIEAKNVSVWRTGSDATR